MKKKPNYGLCAAFSQREHADIIEFMQPSSMWTHVKMLYIVTTATSSDTRALTLTYVD